MESPRLSCRRARPQRSWSGGYRVRRVIEQRSRPAPCSGGITGLNVSLGSTSSACSLGPSSLLSHPSSSQNYMKTVGCNHWMGETTVDAGEDGLSQGRRPQQRHHTNEQKNSRIDRA
ncbi:hypothetical protein KC19_5G026800 [Ceratodon purpureus]|uniref:Uncharacterized protein n=1 Tax=Ceratodon purpureus TaxID=3225 RepID=A0A8T0HZJ2_CERPU|nr:hypothetical protein KC19_5G026800 [Ceratodon purpureus]